MSATLSEESAARPARVARALAALVTAAVLFGVGLVSGWFAASTSPRGAAGEPHAGEGAGAAPRLSPRTVANLGVRVEPLALSEHVDTRDVPAVVVLAPAATRPVHTPVAGTLLRVLVREGQKVAAGQPVAEVLRDPFPRAALPLTDQFLRPLNEDFHKTLAELRSAAQALEIVRAELARIRKVMSDVGGSTLPVKAEIDLVYEERRGVAHLENARAEALRHGLTEGEVAAVEAGGRLPADFPMARRVLERNGLWSEGAQAILDALPPASRTLPYATVVLGELVGTQALAPALVEAVRARPALANAFLDLAGLVQGGTPVEALLALEARGALDPVVVLRAPAGEGAGPDGDVARVAGREGARVEAGAVVAEVVDPRAPLLRLSPAGADLPAVASATAAGETVSAEPLVEGAGPALEGLRLLRVEADADGSTSHGAALVPVVNEPLAEARDAEGRTHRSWRLRPGMRYVVRLPQRRLKDRFVLPAEAVTWRGPESVVLLEDGDGFRAVPVRVEHSDARVVVVANDGAVFAGDRVVVRGTYALALALQALSGGATADPHAGHNH